MLLVSFNEWPVISKIKKNPYNSDANVKMLLFSFLDMNPNRLL